MVAGADILAGLQLVFSSSALASKPAQVVGGTVIFCTAMEAAALVNLGDPNNFWDPAEKWREVSTSLTSSWTLINSTFGRSNGDWSGDTAQTFTSWFNDDLKPTADALKTLVDELATQLDTVGGAILVMDIAGVTFSVVYAVFMVQLLAWWAASLGTLTPAVTAAGIAYGLGLLAWMGAMAAMISAFVSATGAVEGKAGDLVGKLWSDTGKQEGALIKLNNTLANADNWQHNSDLDSQDYVGLCICRQTVRIFVAWRST